MKLIFRICLLFVSFSKTASYLQLNSIKKLSFSTSIVQPIDKKCINIIKSRKYLPLLTTAIQIKEKNPQPGWKYFLTFPLIILRFVRSILFKIQIIVKYPIDRIYKKPSQDIPALPPSGGIESYTVSIDNDLSGVLILGDDKEELTWRNFRNSVSNQLNAQEAQAAKDVLKLKFSMEEITNLPEVSESEISSVNSLHSTFNSLPEVATSLMTQDIADATVNLITEISESKISLVSSLHSTFNSLPEDATFLMTEYIADTTGNNVTDYNSMFTENDTMITGKNDMITESYVFEPSCSDNDVMPTSNTLSKTNVMEESVNSPERVFITSILTSSLNQSNEIEKIPTKERKITQLYKENILANMVKIEDLLNNDNKVSPANGTISSKLKSTGTSGVISYALTELTFWTISIPIIIASYHSSTNEWLNISNENDRLKIVSLSAGFFTVARLAVPIRFALALALTPFIEKIILPKLSVFKSKEKFNLKDVIQSIMAHE